MQTCLIFANAELCECSKHLNILYISAYKNRKRHGNRMNKAMASCGLQNNERRPPLKRIAAALSNTNCANPQPYSTADFVRLGTSYMNHQQVCREPLTEIYSLKSKYFKQHQIVKSYRACKRSEGAVNSPKTCLKQALHTKSATRVSSSSSSQNPVVMSQEKDVTFVSDRGVKLAGILRESKTKKAAILCHGLGSHKNGFHLRAIAEALDQHGIASLRLDFPGCADSEGDFKYANIEEEAGCIQSAYDLLRSNDYTVEGLLGHSKSGSGVLVHAAKYGNIPRVVVCSGRFNHQRGVKERFGDDVFERVERDGGIPQTYKASWGVREWVFDKQDLADRMSMDMHKVCSKVDQGIGILILHGTEDETIPVEDANSLAAELPKSKLKIIEGGNHSFTEETHAKQVIGYAVEFLAAGQ